MSIAEKKAFVLVEDGIRSNDVGKLIALKCADDGPSWDQRVWPIEVTHEDDENWYGYHGGRPHQGDPSQFPKFAWKHVPLPLTH